MHGHSGYGHGAYGHGGYGHGSYGHTSRSQPAIGIPVGVPAVPKSYLGQTVCSPLLATLAASAVAASSVPSNVHCGRNGTRTNAVYIVANTPESISEAARANLSARVDELRSVGRDAEAAELERTVHPAQPLQPFQCAPMPPPSPSNLVTSVSESRHFRLGAARLLWAFLNRQPTVRLLPASPPLLLRAAAEQLLSFANRKQPTTHASLDAGAAFSICAKWVFADDRAALLAVLRVGSGAPLSPPEGPVLARLAFQILLMDNQAARRHGYGCLAIDRALGSTADAFPDLQQLLHCANGTGGAVPAAAPATLLLLAAGPAGGPLPAAAAVGVQGVVGPAAAAAPFAAGHGDGGSSSTRRAKRPRTAVDAY